MDQENSTPNLYAKEELVKSDVNPQPKEVNENEHGKRRYGKGEYLKWREENRNDKEENQHRHRGRQHPHGHRGPRNPEGEFKHHHKHRWQDNKDKDGPREEYHRGRARRHHHQHDLERQKRKNIGSSSSSSSSSSPSQKEEKREVNSLMKNEGVEQRESNQNMGHSEAAKSSKSSKISKKDFNTTEEYLQAKQRKKEEYLALKEEKRKQKERAKEERRRFKEERNKEREVNKQMSKLNVDNEKREKHKRQEKVYGDKEGYERRKNREWKDFGNKEERFQDRGRGGGKFHREENAHENKDRKSRKDRNFRQQQIMPMQVQAPMIQHVISENGKSGEEKQIPECLVCPINQDLMYDPVMVTVCGHTFDRSAIEAWMKKDKSCPLCKKPATVQNLQKNFALAALTETYR